MPQFDTAWFRTINDLAGKSPALDAIGVFFASYLLPFMVAALAVNAALPWIRRANDSEKRKSLATFASAMIAGGLAELGNNLFSRLYFRPRPFVAMQVHQLIAKSAADHSFPSGHASFAFAVAFTYLFVQRRIGIALLVCAAAIAVGRVYVGVHYPLDVIAGVAVGFFWAVVVRAVRRRAASV